MEVKKRGCTNSVNSFCYVCGKFTPKSQKRTITDRIKNIYRDYFGCVVNNENKPWIPTIVCLSCTTNLYQWGQGKIKSMPFAKPMLWLEPSNHIDCYFCKTEVFGFNKKNKPSVKYADVKSARKPVLHGEKFPVPKALLSSYNEDVEMHEVEVEDEIEDETENTKDEDFICSDDEESPKLLGQAQLNEIVRRFYMNKEEAEILGSMLRSYRLLASGTKTSIYRNRSDHLVKFFEMRNGFCVCKDIDGLMKTMGIEHKPEEWRLFIDGSIQSLKAVLLHNGNNLPSIPLIHAIDIRENYKSMRQILNYINYSKYKWQICADLKVIGLLMGLRTGYVKYCCFLCQWDSRDRENHYKEKNWEERKTYKRGEYSMKMKPAIDPKKVLLPPLHIKLGLIQSFIRALNKKKGRTFAYIKRVFPKKSVAKLKHGILNGPEIRKLLKDKKFPTVMNRKEKSAWAAFTAVVEQFLGNKKAANYVELVGK